MGVEGTHEITDPHVAQMLSSTAAKAVVGILHYYCEYSFIQGITLEASQSIISRAELGRGTYKDSASLLVMTSWSRFLQCEHHSPVTSATLPATLTMFKTCAWVTG